MHEKTGMARSRLPVVHRKRKQRKTLNGAKLVKGFYGAPNRIRTCGLLIRRQLANRNIFLVLQEIYWLLNSLTTILTTRGHFFESGERLLSAKIRYMVINFQNHFFISMTHPFHCELEISSGIAKHGAVAVAKVMGANRECFPIGQAKDFGLFCFSCFDESFNAELERVVISIFCSAMMPTLRVTVQLSFDCSEVRIPSAGEGAFRHQTAVFASRGK